MSSIFGAVMTDINRLAQELDRVVRKIDAQMHRLMPAVDAGRVGPMGSLLLMRLEDLQPCSIQTIAKTMRRDSSQLTRLIRDLEQKGLLSREQSTCDGRISLLRVSPTGAAFLAEAKAVLAEVVGTVAEPLSVEERDTLLYLLAKM